MTGERDAAVQLKNDATDQLKAVACQLIAAQETQQADAAKIESLMNEIEKLKQSKQQSEQQSKQPQTQTASEKLLLLETQLAQALQTNQTHAKELTTMHAAREGYIVTIENVSKESAQYKQVRRRRRRKKKKEEQRRTKKNDEQR